MSKNNIFWEILIITIHISCDACADGLFPLGPLGNIGPDGAVSGNQSVPVGNRKSSILALRKARNDISLTCAAYLASTGTVIANSWKTSEEVEYSFAAYLRNPAKWLKT